jgi:hypothetical protein
MVTSQTSLIELFRAPDMPTDSSVLAFHTHRHEPPNEYPLFFSNTLPDICVSLKTGTLVPCRSSQMGVYIRDDSVPL